jgi:NitT/TauT family transport system substrate-binding protein
MPAMQSRRRFLAGTFVAAAGFFGSSKSLRAEPPPETTTVRLPAFSTASCDVPVYVAEVLLRAEGFTDVRYVEGKSGVDSAVWIARGEVDFDWNYAAIHIASIDAGAPITVLAGLHSGCLELIGNDSVHSVMELRDRRVGVYSFSSSPHILVKLMADYVGLDPERDIQWVEDAKVGPMDLFIEGKIDAFLGAPPEPQMLRARKIGHTILATASDQPWAQYYCCMLAGATEYVNKNPVATKRVLRALLKAVDLCASEPNLVAQQLTDGSLKSRSEYALETLTDVRYDKWREYDPEDTIRFYALRLHEVGLIKSDPNKIFAKGTDWHFLDELKRELKS